MQKYRNIQMGQNSIISENVILGNHVILGNNCTIKDNVIIGDNVVMGDNVYIDYQTIIRNDVQLGTNCMIGANCILGEYQMDFFKDRQYHKHELIIGDSALIRSGTIIYSGSNIGGHFQTGHNVTIREDTVIKNNVSIGTLSDIQGKCEIGNYTRLHSNVHIGRASQIDDCCWIYPYVVLTNDPTPPSDTEWGVHVHSFSVLATSSTILPGVEIFSDSLIGAGSVVTKDVEKYSVVVGNPAKHVGDIRKLKHRETGEVHYPWRYYFDRAMPWQNYGFDRWLQSVDDNVKAGLWGDDYD